MFVVIRSFETIKINHFLSILTLTTAKQSFFMKQIFLFSWKTAGKAFGISLFPDVNMYVCILSYVVDWSRVCYLDNIDYLVWLRLCCHIAV